MTFKRKCNFDALESRPHFVLSKWMDSNEGISSGAEVDGEQKTSNNTELRRRGTSGLTGMSLLSCLNWIAVKQCHNGKFIHIWWSLLYCLKMWGMEIAMRVVHVTASRAVMWVPISFKWESRYVSLLRGPDMVLVLGEGTGNHFKFWTIDLSNHRLRRRDLNRCQSLEVWFPQSFGLHRSRLSQVCFSHVSVGIGDSCSIV